MHTAWYCKQVFTSQWLIRTKKRHAQLVWSKCTWGQLETCFAYKCRCKKNGCWAFRCQLSARKVGRCLNWVLLAADRLYCQPATTWKTKGTNSNAGPISLAPSPWLMQISTQTCSMDAASCCWTCSSIRKDVLWAWCHLVAAGSTA